jgi:hypothetical protein
LDTAKVKLTLLGTKSTLVKPVTLEGADLTVEVMIHKATKTKEMAIVSVMKKQVGEILEPFVPLNDNIAQR